MLRKCVPFASRELVHDYHLVNRDHEFTSSMKCSITLPRSNPIWLPAAILKKWICRHNSAHHRLITTKFGRQMQNDMAMTMHRSKSKPEIEFQNGGRSFSETRSSFISSVD